MKKLNGVFGLVCVALMSVSCVNLDGQIDIKQSLPAKVKSGFLHLKTKQIQIAPSLYSASLVAKGDNNFTLRLEGRDTIIVPIKSKSDLNVPSTGAISISHDDIGQPFDLKGRIETDVAESPRVETIQQCSRQVVENHCQKVCDKPDHCNIVCKDVTISIPGRQEISFHDETIHRDIQMNFLQIGSASVLASFQGQNTETSRINDYTGECR